MKRYLYTCRRWEKEAKSALLPHPRRRGRRSARGQTQRSCPLAHSVAPEGEFAQRAKRSHPGVPLREKSRFATNFSRCFRPAGKQGVLSKVGRDDPPPFLGMFSLRENRAWDLSFFSCLFFFFLIDSGSWSREAVPTNRLWAALFSSEKKKKRRSHQYLIASSRVIQKCMPWVDSTQRSSVNLSGMAHSPSR